MGQVPIRNSPCVKALLKFCCYDDSDENTDPSAELNAISMPIAIACCGGTVDQTDNDEAHQDPTDIVGEHLF